MADDTSFLNDNSMIYSAAKSEYQGSITLLNVLLNVSLAIIRNE